METIVLPGVTKERAMEWMALGQSLGLTEFNPTTVNWDIPTPWSQLTPGAEGGKVGPSGVGYAIILGFGIALSIITTILSFMETKFAGVVITSEHFNTAGRDVKTGLTAAVIVSQWTWAATLLQSSNVAWSFGLSGPYWYAAGASVQVLLFGVLAIEVKRKAPTAHTVAEMADVRWGKACHITIIIFCFLTNIIVTSMLFLGGSAVMSDAFGVNTIAGNFLTPLTVWMYTQFGGLKATFLASYIHTAIIFVGLVVFVTTVYISSDRGGVTCAMEPTKPCSLLGSSAVVWERLKFLVNLPVRQEGGFRQGPIKSGPSGNANGSYLTMMSYPGLQFGIINTIGNFGTVFVDQSYWQSAIAATPASAHRGYMLGGLVWFTIPFALATSLGLAGLALNGNITAFEAGSGLVPPASATMMGGPGYGVLMIIMLFMAITSTGSAEAIAVSSLITYDIYRKYINPEADNRKIMLVSRGGVAAYCLLCGIFPTILWAIGLNLGWVYNFMGVVIGSAVIPVSYLLLWTGCSSTAVLVGCWGGQILGLIVFFSTGASLASAAGKDLVWGTSQLDAQMAGNLVAILTSGFMCTLISVLKPQNFDWNVMKTGIKLVGTEEEGTKSGPEATDEFLLTAREWIIKYGCGGTIFLLLGWPLAVLPWGDFSKACYAIWTSIAVMWGYLAAIIIITLPIYENRNTFWAVLTCNPSASNPDAKSSTIETAAA